MNVIVSISIGLVCLVLLAAGLAISVVSFNKGHAQVGGAIPAAVGAICVIGFLVYGVFGAIDGEVIDNYGNILGALVGLTLVMAVKGLLSGIILFTSLAWSFFQFSTNGLIDLSPIYSIVIDGMLFWAPDWMQVGYIWSMFIWTIGVCFTAVADMN